MMKRDSDIENELKDISPLVSGIQRTQVHPVPPDYFTDLPQQIMARIKSEEVENEMTAEEEINQLSPLIATLKHQPGLTVPHGYFNSLPQDIVNRIAEEENKTPVISINTARSRKRILFAAAAVVTGLLLVSSIVFLQFRSGETASAVAQNEGVPAITNQLPSITDNALADYLSAVPGLSELNSDDADTGTEQVAFFELNDSNFGEMSKDITDETLKNYVTDIFGEGKL